MKRKTFRKQEHTLDKHCEVVANNTNTPDPDIFYFWNLDLNFFYKLHFDVSGIFLSGWGVGWRVGVTQLKGEKTTR